MSTQPSDEPLTPPPPTSVRRPGIVTAGAVMLAVAGVLCVLFAFLPMLHRMLRDGVVLYHLLAAAGMQAAIGVALLAAAGLVLAGREAGRALGFAASGVAVWMGVNAAMYTVIDSWSGALTFRRSILVGVYAGWIAIALFAIAASLVLLGGATIDWIRQRGAARTPGTPAP